METFEEIQDWVLAELNDTSSTMRGKVKRYINTLLTPEYVGCDYSFNLNATVWALASGASTVTLPASMADYSKGNFFNLSYSAPMIPAGKRRSIQVGADSGVIQHYWRQGNNFVFNPAFGSQSLYFEWFPKYASLSSNGDIPLIPNKQILAEGAKWMAYKGLKKEKDAQEAMSIFYTLKQQMREADGIEQVIFEDPGDLLQVG